MNDITKSSIASAFQHLVPQGLGQGVSSGFSRIGHKLKVWFLKHQGETYYFTRDDDNTSLPYIDVVILGENPRVSKTYYPDGYTEGANNAPTCAAINGDVPDPGVPIPQSPTCASCKHNVWITLPSGSKTQECKSSKRVAVLLMPAMTEKMLGAPLLDPVMLHVPQASLRSLKSYGDGLKHRGVHEASVVTRISFDRERQYQMNFETKQPLTNNEAPVVLPLLEDPQTINILGLQKATVHQIEQHRPKREERAETGILKAFGTASVGHLNNEDVVTRPRAGRPPGSSNKPKPVEIEATATPIENTAEQQETAAPYDESDPQLDDTLKKVVEQKIHGMLK